MRTDRRVAASGGPGQALLMGKLLLLVLAVVAALLWFRYKARVVNRRDAPGAAPGPARVENMVQCANCGVHLPAAESVTDAAGLPFCSTAHRLAGKSGR